MPRRDHFKRMRRRDPRVAHKKPLTEKLKMKFLQGKKTVITSVIVFVIGFFPSVGEWFAERVTATGLTTEQALAAAFLFLRFLTKGKVDLQGMAGPLGKKLGLLLIVVTMALSMPSCQHAKHVGVGFKIGSDGVCLKPYLKDPVKEEEKVLLESEEAWAELGASGK